MGIRASAQGALLVEKTQRLLLSLVKRNTRPSPRKQAETECQSLKTENDQLQQLIHRLRAELSDNRSNFEQINKINQSTLERYYTTFQEMPLPCFTVNDVGHIIEWNRAAVEFFGFESVEVVDKPLNTILGEAVFRGHAQDRIYQVFLGNHPPPAKISISTKNGETRTVTWFTSPVKNLQGSVVGAVNTFAVIRLNDQPEN